MCVCVVIMVFILDTSISIFWVTVWKEKEMDIQCNGNINIYWELFFFIILIIYCRLTSSLSILITNECLICSAVCKMCNAEQNFMTENEDYLGKYLNNSKIQNEADDLKCNFWSHEAIFSKSTNRAKLATIASRKIAETFPKWRKCVKVVVVLKKV